MIIIFCDIQFFNQSNRTYTCSLALFWLAKLYKYVARYVIGSFGRALATSVNPLIKGSPSAEEQMIFLHRFL